MEQKSIVLCGFMGCGKTTVGMLLAKKLGIPFYDLDYEIEKREHRTIPDIFAQQGEGAFRQLEHDYLCKLAVQSGPAVLSPGGGALTFPRNVQLLKNKALIVLIYADFETCWQRIKNTSRPLVHSNTKEQLHELFSRRLPLYRKISELEVCSQEKPEDTVNKILQAL